MYAKAGKSSASALVVKAIKRALHKVFAVSSYGLRICCTQNIA